jgi:hypothetical protein
LLKGFLARFSFVGNNFCPTFPKEAYTPQLIGCN